MKLPFALPDKPLILASSSPRRAELMRKIGLVFEVQASAAPEEDLLHCPPHEMVQQLAQRKALAVAEEHERALVIGADTTVVLDQQILGKPASPAHAREMLAKLSGRTHQVYTGFAIVDKPSQRMMCGVENTSVTFRRLSPGEIAAYVDSGEALDKAGAYGIQDFSAVFAERIEGCFYNVVGFPLARFYLALQEFLENK